MKTPKLLVPVLTAIAVTVAASFVIAAEETPITKAMDIAHKAPKGEKKLCEKIVGGTATDAEVKTALDAYKAIGDTKPPRGDAAEFKGKVAKLIAATEDVLAKKDGAAAGYKAAVNCKECHSKFKPEDKK
jgi:cytochrome c556